MRILLLGSNGQIGNSLIKKLNKKYELIKSYRHDIDLEKTFKIKEFINDMNPDLIINAAAYTNVDSAEKNSSLAYNINSEAVKLIAQESQKKNIFLIHYSTDYVFDGFKKSPYKESDITNPLNIYGKSKLYGENFITNLKFNYLIFRTSWVYGDYGKNFIKTILKLAENKDTLEVVNDQFGTPTSTNLISLATANAIDDFYNSRIWEPGIYHLSPNGKTSWFNIAKKVMQIASFTNKSYGRVEIKPIKTKDYKFLAKRPINSLLNCTKISKKLSFNLPYWDCGLEDVVFSILSKND